MHSRCHTNVSPTSEDVKPHSHRIHSLRLAGYLVGSAHSDEGEGWTVKLFVAN